MWRDLDIENKSLLMDMFISHGIENLGSMISTYDNMMAEGGDMGNPPKKKVSVNYNMMYVAKPVVSDNGDTTYDMGRAEIQSSKVSKINRDEKLAKILEDNSVENIVKKKEREEYWRRADERAQKIDDATAVAGIGSWAFPVTRVINGTAGSVADIYQIGRAAIQGQWGRVAENGVELATDILSLQKPKVFNIGDRVLIGKGNIPTRTIVNNPSVFQRTKLLSPEEVLEANRLSSYLPNMESSLLGSGVHGVDRAIELFPGDKKRK